MVFRMSFWMYGVDLSSGAILGLRRDNMLCSSYYTIHVLIIHQTQAWRFSSFRDADSWMLCDIIYAEGSQRSVVLEC